MKMNVENTREMNAIPEYEIWDWKKRDLKHSIDVELKRLWKLTECKKKRGQEKDPKYWMTLYGWRNIERTILAVGTEGEIHSLLNLLNFLYKVAICVETVNHSFIY